MGRSKAHVWCPEPQHHQLTPLMEGPSPPNELPNRPNNKERMKSWPDAIRSWVMSTTHSHSHKSRSDLQLLLGVLGCPLAPIPSPVNESNFRFSIKDNPIDRCSAGYIIHQYLAATGCLKLDKCVKNMYVAGSVSMVCYGGDGRRGLVRNGRGTAAANGSFVLWLMSPGMWLVEMQVIEPSACKVVAGSDGKVVWRRTPWLGTNAARGPRRPLRRVVQGLDPRCTATMFAKAQCIGEKRIGDDDCFVLKVTADREAIAERSCGHDGQLAPEVIRHVLYGYFSQRSGLLVYIEDSHLTRVHTLAGSGGAAYWETTIGSNMQDYRDIDGVLVAHQGRSVATLYRFGESSAVRESSRSCRMEEAWRIDDVAFNVAGLSIDCFIPPVEVLNVVNGST